jgi:hypothetical protein
MVKGKVTPKQKESEGWRPNELLSRFLQHELYGSQLHEPKEDFESRSRH